MVVDYYVFFEGMRLLVAQPITLDNLPFLAFTVLLVSTFGAVSFTFSHEAFHKDSKFERFLGTVNMLKTLYIHFFTEHLHGHHKNVATPLDAASANLGDNVYSFVIKSISHSYGSSYRIERDKFRKPFLLNLTVWSVVLTFLLPSLVGWKFGCKAMFFFSLNAFLQVFFLEVINFIEHYGLRR
jgi:alkane 1-monooxygenase